MTPIRHNPLSGESNAPSGQAPGFALISTLSLLVLLALVAIGLLSLSTITIRDVGSGRDLAEARANARLALLLALNDLQVHAGPDTRITAPAGVFGEGVPRPALTGVWNAHALDPSAPHEDDDLGKSAKSEDFRRWLVSNPSQEDLSLQEFVHAATTDEPVLLSSRYSTDGSRELRAGLIQLQRGGESSPPRGRLAYAVFDEGTKARVDLGSSPAEESLASSAEQLGAGQRPSISRTGSLSYASDKEVNLATEEGTSLVAKMVTLGSAEFGHQSPKDSYTRRFHDFTSHSLGLLTNTSRGGLKKDLNLLAGSNRLPGAYADGLIYETEFDLKTKASPTWRQALEFANLFNDRNSRRRDYLEAGPGGTPTLAASAPSDWTASKRERGGIALPNPDAPTGPVILPSIAKVQMVYSLHAHDLFFFTKDIVPLAEHFHTGPFNRAWKRRPGNQPDPSNWSGKNEDREVNYRLWVFCTPIVTLHNPYNTALEFRPGELVVDFVNVPFAMRFFINGTPQTKDLVPYTDMFYWNDKGEERRYTLTLYNKAVTGSDVSIDERTPIRLLPGEVKVFSPYMNPNVKYTDRGSDSAWYNVYNQHTSDIKAIPGWLGEGIGYGQDQPLPDEYDPLRLSVDEKGRVVGDGRMMQDGLVLTGDEQVHVEFAPLPNKDEEEKRFTIEMTLQRANRDRNARTVVLDFDYELTEGLQSVLLGEEGTIRWPADEAIQASELRDHWETPLRGFTNIRPFALLSAYAKTTHGGVDSSYEDGRYPAKPWVFNNHAGAVSNQKIVSGHPAHHSHEINLVRLPGHTEEAIDIQPGTDRGNFVTGHTVFNGRRFGTMLDVPLGPIQSPVSLNGANLAAGYHLPRFTSPIGNSLAHPVMSSDALIEGGVDGDYLDHCYLLNAAFFDGYYCSGIQDREGPFGDGRSSREVAQGFFREGARLADSRLTPHFADGKTPADTVADLTSARGFEQVGAHQLLRGAFNVNSTSVAAWKAQLASLSGTGAKVYQIPVTGGASESLETLDPAEDPMGARFSRFRLPNAQPDASDPDALWHASRNLTESELDRLAHEIVAEVRERGPFLSMHEFVNRRIGPPSELTLKGALQAAIDRANVNETAELGGYEIGSDMVFDLELRSPKALTGNSAEGAPGVLVQSDLLAVLGNSATVRSDTFLIRGYGEATDATGKVTARAWCEAVVQRLPEFVDRHDPATTPPEELTELNQAFGRRFEMVSFRWLKPGEV